MPPPKSKALLGSDDEGETITINRDFAKKYEDKKKKEDLTNLKRFEEVIFDYILCT